jgi:glycosyltransferase involved in cell wall biosynthesis
VFNLWGKRFFTSITSKSLKAAFLRGLSRSAVPDVYIGKFLFPGGWAAVKAKSIYNRKAYVDLGESDSLLEMQQDDIIKARGIFEALDGVFCVSPRLVHEAIALGAKPEKVVYVPNTVEVKRFRPLNKVDCRNKLGLPQHGFIIVFVGHFIERKGPLRVLQALNALSIPVKGIFLGQGPQAPKGRKVHYCGSVPNQDLPIWLNSADVFVLPTFSEGNCNAINEAMACGIPVISSNIADIRPQVPDDAGILIEPDVPDQIASAIKKLYYNKDLLASYGLNGLKYAQSRNEKSRAKQIIDWIVQRNPEFSI